MTPTREMSPPRVAAALLGACLPAGTVRESVLGDLHEAYLDLAESELATRRHLCRADLWYWRQAFALGIRFLPRRRRGRRFTEGSLPRHCLGITSKVQAMNNYDSGIRQQRIRNGLASAASEVRFAVRTMLRRPVFSIAAVVSLSLGIGASAAVFSLVNGVLLKPLAYPESERLVGIFRVIPKLMGENPTASDLAGWYAVPFALYSPD